MNYTQMKEQLADSSRALADLTANMIMDRPELIKDLIEVCEKNESPWCQRASHILSICGNINPDILKPYIPRIIKNLALTKSESVRRNYLKIFLDEEFTLKEKDRGKLVDLCFEYLSKDFSVGVKVYSMDILFTLCSGYPELLQELGEIVESQMQTSSAGYKSRGNRLLAKIHATTKVSLHSTENAADR